MGDIHHFLFCVSNISKYSFSFRKERDCPGTTEFCGGRHMPGGRMLSSRLAEVGSGHGLCAWSSLLFLCSSRMIGKGSSLRTSLFSAEIRGLHACVLWSIPPHGWIGYSVLSQVFYLSDSSDSHCRGTIFVRGLT